MENKSGNQYHDAMNSEKNSISNTLSTVTPPLTFQETIDIVRDHFVRKGYRVHSGLQFGCELVLYADDPSRVHSDFCVHVVPHGGALDMRTLQTLVRSMPDLHKSLIVASVAPNSISVTDTSSSPTYYEVEELAILSSHAPFRRKHVKDVGQQIKPGTSKRTRL